MIVDVVGGTYAEYCREAGWEQLFGSGLRAGAAISSRARVRYHTYISGRLRHTLGAYCTQFGIDGHFTESPSTVEFEYAHGLARPWIHPQPHLLEAMEPLEVEGENVLRFGMLEGDAIVSGGQVVYDPQSTYDPQPFAANGSSADRLAIVANQREGRLLTGEKELDRISEALQRESGAEAVVLKRGASGARVYHGGRHRDVPAFRTNRVFPLGSGDVFAAAFALAWFAGAPPWDATRQASGAAAFYCATRTLPLAQDPEATSHVGGEIHPTGGPKQVYLAGPFFTTADRWLVHEALDGLRQQGVSVFSPFHHVGMGSAEEVAPKDIVALEASQSVLALVSHLDAGTLFEVGYARARGIPVVCLAQNEPPEALKMLEGTNCVIVDDFVSAVYLASWAAIEA